MDKSLYENRRSERRFTVSECYLVELPDDELELVLELDVELELELELEVDVVVVPEVLDVLSVLTLY